MFSLSTLSNTLIVGVTSYSHVWRPRESPRLEVAVMQFIILYNSGLFLFEYKAAMIMIMKILNVSNIYIRVSTIGTLIL